MRRFLKRLLLKSLNQTDAIYTEQFQAVLYPLLCTFYLSNYFQKPLSRKKLKHFQFISDLMLV